MVSIQVSTTAALMVICVISGVMANYGGGHYDHYVYPRYGFKYGVNDAYSGDVKQHQEFRDGDVVKGHYSLLEPDGSTRLVQYHADGHNGFNAVVKKLGGYGGGHTQYYGRGYGY